MEEPVTLVFNYEEDEIVAASRQFYGQIYNLRFYLVLSALIAAFGFILVFWTEAFFLGYTFLLLGGTTFYLNYLTYFNSPKNYFRRNIKSYTREIELQFFEDKVLCFSDVGESKNDWEFYEKVWETDLGYFLFYSADLFLLVPKRVFNNRQEELSFKELVSRKIGPITKIGGILEKEVKGEQKEYLPPPSPPDWR